MTSFLCTFKLCQFPHLQEYLYIFFLFIVTIKPIILNIFGFTIIYYKLTIPHRLFEKVMKSLMLLNL